MKMTVLNLRKIGFAVVAASSMLVFSCGAEETTEATEAPAETPAETPAPEVAPEPVAVDTTAPACEDASCEDAH
jgi:hypothetical protein